MTKIPFGQAEDEASGVSVPVTLDLDSLISSRLLLCANSGGGKSYALRGVCERAGKRVPLIVLDPEGEFASLREQLDVVLVGRGREVDIPANVRTAGELALRLLELGTSAVIDIYELSRQERRQYVRRFLESLMGAPKRLWTSTLVVVDEAHDYAPEGARSEAHDAVVSLMCQGRKRGFCGILATQRLSKLSKDAAAECNNVALGRTTLDVDLRRAGDLIGFSKSRWSELQGLEPGEFYTYGPAFSHKGVERSRSLAVDTSHPKPGSRKQAPPAPSSRVKAIVGQLEELAKRDEGEVTDLDEARAEIQRLRGEAAKAQERYELVAGDAEAVQERMAAMTAENEQRKEALRVTIAAKDARIAGLERQLEQIRGASARFADQLASMHKALREGEQLAEQFRRASSPQMSEEAAALDCEAAEARRQAAMAPAPRATIETLPGHGGNWRETIKQQAAAQVHNGHAKPAPAQLGGPDEKVLHALGWWRAAGVEAPTRAQVAFVAGYKPSTGHFGNTLGRMRTEALIEYPAPGTVTLTSAGAAKAPHSAPPTLRELHERILGILNGPQRVVMERIMHNGRRDLSREALAQACGYQPKTGHYGNILGQLRTLGLIEYPKSGVIAATALVFPEGLR